MEEEEYWDWAKGEVNLTNHVLEFTQPITPQTFDTFFRPKLRILGLTPTDREGLRFNDRSLISFIYITETGVYVVPEGHLRRVESILVNVGWIPTNIFNANEIFSLHCMV